ncbi:MAG: class II fructose-bisphosphate aldolase [Clostridia bacterium]|nr:class II fructose-bisphosphate aldolase [Clostridia bacterium]
MALVRVSEILKMADKANTSVIAFNSSDFNMIHSVFTVAEELNKPALVMLDPRHARLWGWGTPEIYAKMCIEEAAKVKVPVSFHLDHCMDFDFIMRAIKAGFPSVMYDGSMLSYEENMKNTREVVRVAHAMGTDVEAELGHVGFAANETDQDDLDLYTKPEVAARFCEESGCDSVAVAIGTAHGFYKKTPKLDLERLQAINAATETPLVLHGGSGVPDDQLVKAFTMGINKFNVGTEYFYLYYQTVKAYCADHEDIFDIQTTVQAALMDYLRQKMQLCRM